MDPDRETEMQRITETEKHRAPSAYTQPKRRQRHRGRDRERERGRHREGKKWRQRESRIHGQRLKSEERGRQTHFCPS